MSDFLHAPHIPTHTIHVRTSIGTYTHLAQGHATMTSVCIGGDGHEVVNVEEIQEFPVYSRSKRERSWYTADLLRIAQCTPVSAGQVMGNLGKIKTPLVASAWAKALEQHPDRDFVEFVLNGIVQGFCIGFDYHTHKCRPAKQNMISAKKNPLIVEEYLFKEREAGRVVGPLPRESISSAQISPFGVIPKPHQPGKWRLILDLSSPEGASVNDGICKGLCSLRYLSVDDIASTILSLGKGALLAKMDIQSAYRMVPVHPDDHHLLGMQWEGQLFVDTVLPFGLRSAPKIFNAVADALEWIAHSRGAEHIAHYLDDFVVVGAPATNECRRSLDILMSACRELGVPIATHKCEGPSACLTFLGIEVDTQNLELRLPEEKLDRLKKLLVEWLPRKSCKRRDLESLIGHLSQACKVVRPGRRFLRGMIQLLSVAHKQHHHIRLNQSFRADLEWWHKFLGSWNGVSMLVQVQSQHPDIKVWSDASGSWGCAAVWNGKWFQISWKDHPEFMDTSIAGKEMLPIAVAAAIWGKEWRGCTVEFNCDNEAVVHSLTAGSCKERNMAHMLRCLFFIEAKFNFSIVASHVPGVLNVQADALSRNQPQIFFNSNPQAITTPSSVPKELIKGLTKLDLWTSPTWAKWFSIL